MAIPTSGAISLDTIQTEFGGTNPISLDEYYAGGSFVAAGISGTNGAVPSSGAISINQFYGTAKPIVGQQAFTTAGSYSWVAPAGVTSVSVVAVGSGSAPNGASSARASAGGGLGWKNNISVTPGNSYTVVVGQFILGSSTDSYFCSTSVVKGGTATAGDSPGTYTGTGGGNGGSSGWTGGAGTGYASGGAGGYSGNGGNGGSWFSGGASNGTAGSGGGGGGGGLAFATCAGARGGAGGGGVGLLGQGSSGAGGTSSYGSGSRSATGGGGGSGGCAGGTSSSGNCTASAGNGGVYGGGAGSSEGGSLRTAGGGAVRIIWPGNARSFPSTRTANE